MDSVAREVKNMQPEAKKMHAWVHVAAWSLYITVYALIWRLPQMSFLESLLREFLLLPFKMILVYACIYYVIPQALHQKHYLRFVLLLVSLIIGCTLLHNLYLHFLLPPKLAALQPHEALFDFERITKRMTYLTSPMIVAFSIVVIRNWFEQKEQNNRIVQDNLKAQLHLLKQQLQPHFFFNTLNSVYSLALQKSDETPAVILKLSDLMRYLNDQSGVEWVKLSDEVAFITNYVSIEQIRFQDRMRIDFCASIAEPEKISIPPLVLSPFIENAIKHGVREHAAQSVITVNIKEDAECVYYEVINTIPSVTKPTAMKGTGLKNLHSRLEIIYGDRFVMTIHSDECLHHATLQLPKRHEGI